MLVANVFYFIRKSEYPNVVSTLGILGILTTHVNEYSDREDEGEFFASDLTFLMNGRE